MRKFKNFKSTENQKDRVTEKYVREQKRLKKLETKRRDHERV